MNIGNNELLLLILVLLLGLWIYNHVGHRPS
jgi:hypothetical protein